MGLFDSDKSAARLPVSVITGFLGSGKTTLLNKLLRHAGMGDSAVIINEFGEVALDHLLVEAIEGEVAVLASGCVCCTLRSDLEQTLRSLLARRDRGEVPAFSRILVETTGLADPAPIVQLSLNNPLVSHFVRLDTIVTTVDAVNGLRHVEEHAEAIKQAALADRLLLTKTDLAPPETIEHLQRRLIALNPGAVRDLVTNGEISPEALFGAACSILRARLSMPGAGSTRTHTQAGRTITEAVNITIIITTFTLSASAATNRSRGRRSLNGLAACGTAKGTTAARKGHPELDRRERPRGHSRRAPHFSSTRASRCVA